MFKVESRNVTKDQSINSQFNIPHKGLKVNNAVNRNVLCLKAFGEKIGCSRRGIIVVIIIRFATVKHLASYCRDGI